MKEERVERERESKRERVKERAVGGEPEQKVRDQQGASREK